MTTKTQWGRGQQTSMFWDTTWVFPTTKIVPHSWRGLIKAPVYRICIIKSSNLTLTFLLLKTLLTKDKVTPKLVDHLQKNASSADLNYWLAFTVSLLKSISPKKLFLNSRSKNIDKHAMFLISKTRKNILIIKLANLATSTREHFSKLKRKINILFCNLPNCTLLIILCTKPSFRIPW